MCLPQRSTIAATVLNTITRMITIAAATIGTSTVADIHTRMTIIAAVAKHVRGHDDDHGSEAASGPCYRVSSWS